MSQTANKQITEPTKNINDLLKTRQQIAKELGWDVKTLYNKIIKRGLPIDKDSRLTLKEIKLLYEEFGYPPSVKKSDYADV